MKYLGVDFGLRRVGLSISEGELASPFKVISVSSLADSINKILREVREVGADKLVVGLPEGKTGKATLKFIKILQRDGLDVGIADETLSSQQASKMLLELGIPKKKRRKNDAQAAAEILQNYLDNKNR